jgi:Ca-activated chloride channel family protein
LRQGEYGAEEARRGATFSAKVVPIPGYGFKRIEIEYHERLSVEDLLLRFVLPLRPDAYQEQTAGRFALRIAVLSEHPLSGFHAVGDHYPLQITEQSENRIVAELHAANLAFSEDLSVEYSIAGRRDRLQVLTYRDPVPPAPHVTANRLGAPGVVPGYFLASALLSLPNAARQNAADDGPARSVIALFDSSLSMQWGKLDRSFRALETLLQQLRPQDRFNVIVFNENAAAFSPAPVAASAANAARALEFVRATNSRRYESAGGEKPRGSLASRRQPMSSSPTAARRWKRPATPAAVVSEYLRRPAAKPASADVHAGDRRRCQPASAAAHHRQRRGVRARPLDRAAGLQARRVLAQDWPDGDRGS